ncbi:MAG: hydroxyisourate hydrolase [Tepidisphaeraceae bacterium]
MGRLTTHVLDTANGRPAGGMRVTLHRRANDQWVQAADVHTNADGRCDQPLLQGESLIVGDYRLTFFVGAYFARLGAAGAGEFLGEVPIDFRVADAAAHYHVPLLCSPWAYSTYRGS